MNLTYIILGTLFSLAGLIYLRYGKKDNNFTMMICGTLLLLTPLFFKNILYLCLISGLIAAYPFFKRQ